MQLGKAGSNYPGLQILNTRVPSLKTRPKYPRAQARVGNPSYYARRQSCAPVIAGELATKHGNAVLQHQEGACLDQAWTCSLQHQKGSCLEACCPQCLDQAQKCSYLAS